MPEPAISIVIPTFNRAEVLFEALKAVAAQGFKDFECITVDNGPSTDATGEAAGEFSEKDPRFIYLRTHEKGDFKARNIGCGRARADLILTIDDDWIMTDTGTLEHIVRSFETGDRLGGLGISEYYPDGRAKGRAESPAKGSINWLDRIRETGFYYPGMISRWGLIGNKFHYLEIGRKHMVHHVRSSAFAFRKQVFEMAGGFPPCYSIDGNAYRAETEFCLRIASLGWKVAFTTEVQGLHKVLPKQAGSFSRGGDARYFYVTGRNNTLFFLRNYWSRAASPLFLAWDMLVGNSTQPGFLRFFSTHKHLRGVRFPDGSSPLGKSMKGKWQGFIDYHRGLHRMEAGK
ncbi:MAG: glycosyltransferase family 2 protein [Nitrospiraceae bacterium]|nr:glycosyltransferase family 2 protein [Nitrospiraceae bacterium]